MSKKNYFIVVTLFFIAVAAAYFFLHWHREQQQPATSLWVSNVLKSQRHDFGHFALAWDASAVQWQLTYQGELNWQSIPQQAFIQATIQDNDQLINCTQQSIQQLFTQTGLIQLGGQLACGKQLIPYQMEWRSISSEVIKVKLMVLHNQVDQVNWWLGVVEPPSHQLSGDKVALWKNNQQNTQVNMENSCPLPGRLIESCLPAKTGGFYWPSGLTIWRLHPASQARLASAASDNKLNNNKTGWWWQQKSNELALLLISQPSPEASFQLLHKLARHPALQL
ncbi:hypothetical protein H0A36_24525 [Endozoicomonas sp. SM1973]|uniref:Uncharacterized protein n=1 Tax=Spartinivicinus marinus TaxID=2994442 RepID=A0A853I5L4_9GAMM|nr:hypothetical protein [Spartinivicinus marinus]MCX4024916.1 hypothetical protein [Spartinivicinus marinus]NYZ69190.1 hypothetical protein [Spartinivicinus marinus]